MSKPIPMLEAEFHHDGRGPELQKVVWDYRGQLLRGFEYFKPEDEFTERDLRHLLLNKVEVYSMASEVVHKRIAANGETTAAIFRIVDSPWKSTFQQRHLQDCEHFQIIFYDEIFDVICRETAPGRGPLNPHRDKPLPAAAL